MSDFVIKNGLLCDYTGSKSGEIVITNDVKGFTVVGAVFNGRYGNNICSQTAAFYPGSVANED